MITGFPVMIRRSALVLLLLLAVIQSVLPQWHHLVGHSAQGQPSAQQQARLPSFAPADDGHGACSLCQFLADTRLPLPEPAPALAEVVAPLLAILGGQRPTSHVSTVFSPVLARGPPQV